MKICLDYDGTYTLDPSFWNQVIELAKSRGHDIICATMRYEETESEAVMTALGHRVEKIYFTGRYAKQPALNEMGVYPDVWIEDCPQWLLKDAI